jgi:protein phosphatase
VQLQLPRPALVLLVGVAGSGKSTFAARHFRPTEVVSSDACRALVCDDEADQTATADAFALLHLVLEKRLKRGKLTVVDATNVQSWARALLLEQAKAANTPAVAIVLDVPDAVFMERNASRGRVVDPAVLEQQARDLRAGIDSLRQEGFAEVFVLEEPDEAEVRT